MNLHRLELAIVMLREVAAGTWKPSPLPAETEVYSWSDKVKSGASLGFNLNTWLSAQAALPSHFRKGECGFSACAVGHMMIDSRFNAEGLCEKYDSPFYDGEEKAMGWEAVNEFFEINNGVAEHLFNINAYPREDRISEKGITAAMVADRIQETIDRYRAEGWDKA